MDPGIRLLLYSPRQSADDLLQLLLPLGRKVRVVSGHAPAVCVSRQDEVTVALFDTSPAHIPDLAQVRERVSGTHSLLVLRGDPARLDTRTLRLFDELAVWPCTADELRMRLERLGELAQARPADGVDTERFRRLNLVGNSRPFRELLSGVEQVLDCSVTVLLQGETGTGKELVARALHYLGNRCSCPFVPANCGALPRELVESELFGHERGAFTDAHQRRSGLVEIAEGGTLFLDEVDALDPRAQVILLRFLQGQEYRRVGGERICQANVRVVAASNRVLEQEVANGRFREDLYYRLQLYPLCIPPLRDRHEDVVTLARHFLSHYADQYGGTPRRFTPEAVSWMRDYAWPGNVRELENAVHRACILRSCGSIGAQDLTVEATAAPAQPANEEPEPESFSQAKQRALERFERDYLEHVLARAGGNVSHAARIAGKERRALGKLLKKHGIERGRFQPA